MAKQCICPIVEIIAKSGQVTEDTQRQVADLLRASVTLTTSEEIRTIYGKHRDDCPCRPQ